MVQGVRAGALLTVAGCGWALILECGCATQRPTIPVGPPRISPPQAAELWSEPFDALDPTRWREVEVRGQTRYHVVDLEGRRCLQAESQAGASILLSAVRADPETYRWLSWHWRVDRHVAGEALERKEGSDVAARVYVYFDTHGPPWQKRNIDYVWSASLPVGTKLDSAHSSQSKIIVAESGSASLGRWRSVERNLEEDYRWCFGEEPSDVVAIGVMTDTDNTGTEALAYFDDLRLSRSPSAPGAQPPEPARSRERQP